MRQKTIIYQLLVRLFENEPNKSGKMNNITSEYLNDLYSQGYTHIWYTGVLDHATTIDYDDMEGDYAVICKGQAGSPYAVRDFYGIAPEIAQNVFSRNEEFDALLERTNAAGLKVIIDFVPNHTARNYRGTKTPIGEKILGKTDDKAHLFSAQNNYFWLNSALDFSQIDSQNSYFEFPAMVSGNDVFSSSPSATDWYDTAKLNYGYNPLDNTALYDPIPDTWERMLNILKYWTERGVDGFRCDMAGMVPVEFWHYAIPKIKQINSEVLFIAEIYEPQKYYSYIHHGGFDFLYDKVGLFDALIAITKDGAPVSRITSAWQQVSDIKTNMLSFCENHDELRLASKSLTRYGEGIEKAAQRGYVATAAALLLTNGAAMIYFGQENAENADSTGGRTSIFDYVPLDKSLSEEKQKELAQKYRELVSLAQQPPFADGELYDLMWLNPQSADFDAHNVYAFIRHNEEKAALVVLNFSDREQDIVLRFGAHVAQNVGAEALTSHDKNIHLMPFQCYTTVYSK